MSARDYVEKDYYAVLGVARDAKSADVKKAYRKLARELHPDKNPGDTKAEARFKEVSEAYDVLSDDQRRREYDEARTLFSAGGRPGAPGAPGGGPAGNGVPFDLGDLFGGAAGAGGAGGAGFGSLFDNLFQRGGGPTPGARAPRRGTDLTAELTISFDQMLTGTEATVRLPGAAACDVCAGLGTRPGTVPRTCPTCQGLGVVSRSQGGFALSEPCRDCRGKGSIIDDPCPECHGTGRKERQQRIRVPMAVADGQRLRVRGRGAPGAAGGPPGDLEVTVHVRPHPVFGRGGSDLLLTLPVTYAEAVLGAEVKAPTADGSSVTLRIPAGTASGRRLRVRGRGVPSSSGSAGDLLVTVEVVVPERVSAAAKAALEQYAAAVPDDPRRHLTAMVSGA